MKNNFMEDISNVNEPLGDNWGGNWTQNKIEIFIKYLKAYLTIMSKHSYFELWYFDGFAGSGHIFDDETQSFIEGIALKVLEINEPKPFDAYYMVELDKNKTETLKDQIHLKYPHKKCFVVSEDCNDKVVDFANFLRKDSKKRRGLAILDPFGMALNWSSLESFKDLGCDMWILVPTGLGVNRLLKKDGNIDETWMLKLTKFLGLSDEEIKERFYEKKTTYTLFGEEEKVNKVEKATTKIAQLYKERLNEIWKFVSTPHEMKNSRGSVMFHFIFASQVAAGMKIADDIIKSKK